MDLELLYVRDFTEVDQVVVCLGLVKCAHQLQADRIVVITVDREDGQLHIEGWVQEVGQLIKAFDCECMSFHVRAETLAAIGCIF